MHGCQRAHSSHTPLTGSPIQVQVTKLVLDWLCWLACAGQIAAAATAEVMQCLDEDAVIWMTEIWTFKSIDR